MNKTSMVLDHNPDSAQSSSSSDPAPRSRSRLDRPPSIGDASQLFGGGTGSDDFFGPPSTFAASLFDSVPEEPGNSSIVDHDPFAWQSTDHAHHPSPFPSSGLNPAEVPDTSLTQPAATHYDSLSAPSTEHPNPYEPPTSFHNSHSYAQDGHHPVLSPNLNFGLQDHSATGASIPSLQAIYADQKLAHEAYNPYVPTDPYVAHQNAFALPSSHPHLMADVIPRSVSVNALPSSASTNQSFPYLSPQRPKLNQSVTTQLSSSVFNRPRVYDAYDPPAIRKKKPTLSSTASLPASPALGSQGFRTQIVPSNLSFVPPASDVPVPPPPPSTMKQRSTSTPASHHDPIQVSSVGFNDFYTQTSHSVHDTASHFVPSTITNASTSFAFDPYPSNSSTDCGISPDQVTPKPGLSNQYQQNHPHQVEEHRYTQLSHPTVQPSSTHDFQTFQIEDPYSPDQTILPPGVGKPSTSLGSTDLYHPQAPTAPTGSVETPNLELKASSPTDSLVITGDAMQNLSEESQFSRELSVDLIDALSSATQKLSLNSVSQQDSVGYSGMLTPEIRKNSLSRISPAPLANSLAAHEKDMQVPDVHVQPATPQITLVEAHDSAPSRQFDVLADLNTSSTDEAIISSDASNKIPDKFDYGASDDSKLQYSSDYTYGTTQNNIQENLTSSLDNSQPYEPYHASFDSHNPDSISNFNSYPASQPVDFTNSDSHPTYSASSEYNLMADSSTYGNTAEHLRSSFSLQPENIPSDLAISYQQNNTDSWLPEPKTDEPGLDQRAYNPYNPPAQATVPLLNQHENPELERLTAKVPVASFGFGGKLITVFPAITELATDPLQAGYADPYGPSGIFPKDLGAGRKVVVQRLSDVIPSNDLESFPGPLFMEGGSKSNLAQKRKEVIDWLDVKLDESEKELVFIQSQLVGRNLSGDDGIHSNVDNSQDKIILLKLLKLLVENEGKLSGTLKVDEAVRLVLQSTPTQTMLDSNSISSNGLNNQDIIATYNTRSSYLDSIQSILSNGDRKKAIQTALEQKMWPHAFIIAHSLGNDVWHETVKEFVRFELGDSDIPSMSGTASPDSSLPPAKGREALRTLYTLFAGAGSTAVDEFSLPTPHASPSVFQFEQSVMPATSTAAANGTAALSRVPSPALFLHPSQSSSVKIPNNFLQQWRSIVAMTVANRVHGSTPFLLRLADALASSGKTCAAHITYLLSNGQMPQLCLDNGNRITLLGSPILSNPNRPGLDLEAVMLTEVLEFGLSLCTVPKNGEPFIGIPHLQAYRLALGFEYATFGLTDRANRYCEALAATLKLATKACPFYHATLYEQIKAFSGRLSSTPVADKGTSWITRKMPRPILDNVWQTLEGRVHKFVAGDDDDGMNQPTTLNGSTTHKNQVLGPFSHFSSISAGVASESLSRAQSSNDLGYTNTKTTSSLAGPFHYRTHLQRPSSGAGHSPSNHNQETRRVSLSSSYHGSNLSPIDFPPFRGQTSSVPLIQNEQSSLGRASPTHATSQTAEPVSEENPTFTSSGGGWWEASNSYGTPVNSTAQPVFESIQDTPIADDGSGFIDPMASFGIQSFTDSPGTVNTNTLAQRNGFDASHSGFDDDSEDLGFGNNSNRKRDRSSGNNHDNNDNPTDSPTSNKINEKTQDKSEGTTDPHNRSVKAKSSSSWIGRWFKRETTPTSQATGPVKANLGEEFSLVYDPETKRWVNKKAGSSQTPAGSGPAPPPPRAQTASPTSSMRSSFAPPPASSLSNISNNNSPGYPSMTRSNSAGLHNAVRSSLDVPSVSSGLSSNPSYNSPNSHQMNHSESSPLLNSLLSTPPPPPSSNPNTPNPSKKSNAKKNIRSRYVEIR